MFCSRVDNLELKIITVVSFMFETFERFIVIQITYIMCFCIGVFTICMQVLQLNLWLLQTKYYLGVPKI